MPRIASSRLTVAALASLATVASGCMGLSPQLPPTDFAALEKLESRADREAAYAANAIYVHKEPQGARYTKGTDPNARKRSWQSLEVILRSDKNASDALPSRKLRLARLFTALTLAGVVTIVAGGAASAREGLDLKRLTGPAGVLLAGGIATVGFGITAGVLYGRARKDYERAVAIYNDSLGMRLGVLSPGGKFVPPKGVLVDSEGYVVLDDKESRPALAPSDAAAPPPEPAAEPTAPAPEAEPPASPTETPLEEPGDGEEQPEIQRPSRPGAVALRPRG